MMSEGLISTIDDAIKSLELTKQLVSERRVLGSSPLDYPSQFDHGDWECENSPTGCCMYTNREWDSCIFCYEPDERK